MTGKDQPIVGTGIILTREGTILLGLRKTTPSVWSFPGGRLEIGESINQCALRELFEETGLFVKGTPELFAVANIARRPDCHPTVTFGLTAAWERGEAEVRESDKFLKWAWFQTPLLPPDLYVPTRVLLDVWLGKMATTKPSNTPTPIFIEA
jgi:8-oxo-dGTP diphosphatase